MIKKKVVKQYIQEEYEVRVSSNFYDELENKINELIEKAVKRANYNNRKTIYNYDL